MTGAVGLLVASSALETGTLLLTLACLLLVFAPALVEARRLLPRLPRRNTVSPPLAPDAEIEAAVARRLYGHRMRTGPRSTAAAQTASGARSPARTHEGMPRAHTSGPVSGRRTLGSETPARVPRRRAVPRR